MKRHGTTLIETMVAVTIILLIAAIVFPVIANARRSGYRAESMSNLRQIGQAIEMYRSGADGAMPFGHLDTIVQSGLISNLGILRSGTDAFKEGYGHKVSECMDQRGWTNLNTSYETLLSSEVFYDWVKLRDPDAALVVDRTHGQVFDGATMKCNRASFYYTGAILRAYEDTHVKLGHFGIESSDIFPGPGIVFSRFRLFSELPDPKLD